MDHAAVRDWLEDAFFVPGALEADDVTGRAAREHLAACSECAAHRDTLRLTALKLDLARGPSPEVRTRVLDAAARIGRSRRPAPLWQPAPPRPLVRQPWWRGGLAWRLAAAVLVVGVVGAALGAWWAGAARPGSTQDPELTAAVAMMAKLAAQSGTQEAVLRDASGGAAGMVLASAASHQVAVFATDLARPSQGRYDCYLERAGRRTWIGPMNVAEGVQYWAGEMAPSLVMGAGDLLVVAQGANGPAVLSGSF